MNDIDRLKIGSEIGFVKIISKIFSTKIKNEKGKSRVVWIKCKCGNEKFVRTVELLNGKRQSCGCGYGKKYFKKHGDCKTRLYYIFYNMYQRCCNPNNDKYSNYRERGIKICQDWYDYENFKEWSLRNGYSKELTLDRIDNNGNYQPCNCRWSTTQDQNNNRNDNVLLTAFGITKTLANWARDDRCSITENALRYRINQKWAIEEAISLPTIPLNQRNQRKKKYESSSSN